MEFQIEFSYSPKFYSSLARAFWLRNYGPGYLLYVGIPLLTLAFCLNASEITSSRIGHLFMGFLLGFAAALGFQFLHYLFSIDKAMAETAQKWGAVKLVHKFNEEEIISESERSSARYQWKLVQALWQHPTAWILCLGGQAYIALPVELLSDELKHFIVRKVSEAGGKSA